MSLSTGGKRRSWGEERVTKDGGFALQGENFEDRGSGPIYGKSCFLSLEKVSLTIPVNGGSQMGQSLNASYCQKSLEITTDLPSLNAHTLLP